MGTQCWDPRYEFNAPRFYDFEAEHDDSDGDVWFDSIETAGLKSPLSCEKYASSPQKGPFCPPVDSKQDTKPQAGNKENKPVAKGMGVSALISKLPNLFIRTPLASLDKAPLCLEDATTSVANEPTSVAGQQEPEKPSTSRERTTKRKRESPAKENREGAKQQEFGGRRKCTKVPVSLPTEPTVRTGKRARTTDRQGEPANEWKPLALQVAQFESNLACRSHVSTRSKLVAHQPQITVPKDMVLATDLRLRGSKYKPREEEEAELMNTKPPFKARPLRKSIFANTLSNHVTATVSRPLTQAETPPLATKQRAAIHAEAQRAPEDNVCKQFHAQPLNTAILQGPTFLPSRSNLAPTEAQSPNLATRLRNRDPPKAQGPFCLGAAPPTQSRDTVRATPATRNRRLGQQSCRSHAMLTRSQMKSRQPLRDTAVVPAPFHLESVERHEKAAADRLLQQKRKAELTRKACQFKAEPLRLPSKPFVPAPSSKPTTRPRHINLAVATRSMERAKFDEQMAQKEAAHLAEKMVAEQQRREQEAEEIKAYRRTLQFKARPLPRRAR